MRTGRWEVTVSRPGADLNDFDKESADRLRVVAAAVNTTSRCRTSAHALDPVSEISIKGNFREGCILERLTVDPDALSYATACTVGGSVVQQKMKVTFWPDRFVTLRTSSVEGDGAREPSTLRYDGRYDGACRGTEENQPALYSDPSWMR